jgi:hypothetical protein
MDLCKDCEETGRSVFNVRPCSLRYPQVSKKPKNGLLTKAGPPVGEITDLTPRASAKMRACGVDDVRTVGNGGGWLSHYKEYLRFRKRIALRKSGGGMPEIFLKML